MSTRHPTRIGLGAAVLVGAIALIGIVPTTAQSPAASPAVAPAASMGVEPVASAGACPAPASSPMAVASPAAVASAMPVASPAAMASPAVVASPEAPGECPAGAVAEAEIYDFEFEPADLSVSVGTTVTWLNEGPTEHTVTADDGSFDSTPIAVDASFSQTFDTAGTFAYHCTIHPEMIGTVTVA